MWLKAIGDYLEEYSDNSTVHGVKYLGEKRRHWSEKIFWVISLSFSFIGCSIMIYKIYERWESNPVIVSFAEKSTPISQLPFPAVTICPGTKFSKAKMNFTDLFHSVLENKTLTPEEMKNYEAVSQICNKKASSLYGYDENIQSGLHPSEIVDRVENLSLEMNETIIVCYWRGEELPCDTLFTEVITEEGFCFTFNMLDLSELLKQDNLTDDFKYFNNNITSTNWTLQDSYQTTAKETYPRRVLGSGERAGLDVLLFINKTNLDYVCGSPMQGFKIILHTPGEIPRVTKHYFRVSVNQGTIVNVKPNMITTSERLKGYDPERRQCYFDGERNLQFYKVYTQNNCEMECLANYTLLKCGCVKFSMPRYNDTKICESKDMKCHEDAEDHLLEDLNDNLQSDEERENSRQSCGCLPACTSINYDIEMSQVEYDFMQVLKSYKFDEEMKEYAEIMTSFIAIYFKETQFINSKRSELYGWRDFVANCGGLLGLFMGMSIVSIIEIIYYLSLRLFWRLKFRSNSTRVEKLQLTTVTVGRFLD